MKGSSSVAVGYIRVSTEEQARGGVSLEMQESKLRAYCELVGLQLIEIVREEGVSASKPLAIRPEGLKLVALLRRKRVRNVVALKLDRLFRDAMDALGQTREWDKLGVALHLIDMGGQTLNTASAMGRYFLTMTAGFAELERNLISERTAAALAHKRSQGKKTGGDVPFGYYLDTDGKSLVPVEQEQEHIRLICTLRERGLSLRRICRELERREILSKRGKCRWHPQTVSQIIDSYRSICHASTEV